MGRDMLSEEDGELKCPLVAHCKNLELREYWGDHHAAGGELCECKAVSEVNSILIQYLGVIRMGRSTFTSAMRLPGDKYARQGWS